MMMLVWVMFTTINLMTLQEMFLDLDDDGDKCMSWDEFSDVFKKKDPKKVQQSELMDCFKNMDKDGSGRLTVDEIKEAYINLGIRYTDESLQGTIDNADVDGDGKVGYEEFLKAWGS
ncbi:uncharacterized protein [Littorina saxatilis]|uniref:EF-hand domain-containing protein n=1 Tax=Littorina saxatilis TaxID=31220 RepID=A0AAN9ALN6_9CAEN